MWHSIQAKWQSLIFRLLFYFLLAILALAIIVAASFAQRLKPHFQHEILPNVERYIEYLIDDIGYPPDLGIASQLAENLPIELRIVGPNVDWTSSPMIRSIEYYELERAPPPYDDVFIGHHRRDEILLVQRRGYQYLFTLDNSFRQRSERRHWALFLLICVGFSVHTLIYHREWFVPARLPEGENEMLYPPSPRSIGSV